MSMLAGPRRKQKIINLRAKNSAWSNDNNKFGQRMLEKMGWSEGKGLGVNEDGIVEHVIAKYKNDEKGLGFEDRNDQWTKHEDDFNSLLANLSNGDSNEDKLHSGISLETKSKKSKVRVHYHKFTRGKDLSRYSEKDLANIFGKKSFKEDGFIEEPIKEAVETSEQVFTEKGSMEDYFKNKLVALKNKLPTSCNNKYNQDDEEAGYGFIGFSETSNETELETKKQGIGSQSFSFYNTAGNKICQENMDFADVNISNDNIDNTKKKKKKRGSQHQNMETLENCINSSVIKKEEIIIKYDLKNSDTNKNDTEEVQQESVTTKKNKKSKKQNECQEENEPKNKKSGNEFLNHEEIIKDVMNENSFIPKKKKKRKNKTL